jgi:hypothetical protein
MPCATRQGLEKAQGPCGEAQGSDEARLQAKPLAATPPRRVHHSARRPCPPPPRGARALASESCAFSSLAMGVPDRKCLARAVAEITTARKRGFVRGGRRGGSTAAAAARKRATPPARGGKQGSARCPQTPKPASEPRISPSGISALWNSSTTIRCHSTHLTGAAAGRIRSTLSVKAAAAARAQGWPPGRTPPLRRRSNHSYNKKGLIKNKAPAAPLGRAAIPLPFSTKRQRRAPHMIMSLLDSAVSVVVMTTS